MLRLEEQRMSTWYTVAFLSFALNVAAAGQTADISGNWRLNVDRSDWGARPKPASVNLHIEHKEPALVYSGTVIYSGEDARGFSFSGAIDGKHYDMDRSFGAGTAVCRRLNASSFECVFRTGDGTIETTRTVISANGRKLTRHIRLQAREGTSTSTEVYERN
jgi:hypothetical protein